MARWTRLTPALLALAVGGACTGLPDEVSTDLGGSSGSSTGGGMTSPTVGVTMTNGDTLGTMDGSSGSTGPVDPTTGSVDTTVGVSATDSDSTTDGTTSLGPTTSGSSSEGSSTGLPPECMIDDDCGSNEVCDTGSCVEACMGMWGMGNYDYCLDALGGFNTSTACGAGSTCIFNGYPIEGTTCSVQNCVTECDCPAPPPTGNAVVTCADITTGMSNDCFLSCENGETCPDGMFCYAGTTTSWCMTAPDPLPMYGNCGNIVAGCAAGLQCVAENGYTLCVNPCMDVVECDPAPAGALTEVCQGSIYPPNGSECVLPCIDNGDCPGAMECYDDPNASGVNPLCMWPMLSLIPGLDCCTAHFSGGCMESIIEECVCQNDAFCCDTQWDGMCVDQAIMDCYADCP